MDELDRADVEAARRLRGDRDARLLGELARDHDLLLVAARQRARPASSRLAAADVVLLEQRPRALRACAWARAARSGSAAAAVLAQREVLGQRQVEHEAAPVAVLGDVADAARERAAHAARP